MQFYQILGVILGITNAQQVQVYDDLQDRKLEPFDLSEIENSFPTVIFHGINDNCENGGIQQVFLLLNQTLDPAPYSECLEVGGSHPNTYSILASMNKQGQEYCDQIKNHPIFGKSDINVLGFSQGGLMARYIVQECDLGEFKVHNYLSVGGPQQGVLKQPSCFTGFWCDILNTIEKNIVTLAIVQKHLAPAAYFRDNIDARNYKLYLEYSTFLPLVNNEKSHDKYDLYKQRFLALNRLGLVKFDNDTVIYPRESTHFQEIDPETKNIVHFNETSLYQNDTIGLQTLDEQSKVTLWNYEGDHLHFNASQIVQDFIPFLYLNTKNQEFIQ